MYRIICLVVCSVCSSLAADVTIYHSYDHAFADPLERKPLAVSQFPWKFGYVGSEIFYMHIFLSNKSHSVTAINVTCTTDYTTYEMKNGPRKGQEYYFSYNYIGLFTAKIKIQLNLCMSNNVCSSFLVAKGRNVAKITNETLKKKFPHYDICFKSLKSCVVLVDIRNKYDSPPLATKTKMETTTENTVNAERQSSQNTLLIYLIPSGIGMCIIILVIYLISAKKYCPRNSHPVERIELNTYSTANEVVYADLGFERGDSQPPRREEESTYAQIIGV